MVSSVLSSHVEDVVYFDLEILNNVFFPIGIVEELFIIIIIYFFYKWICLMTLNTIAVKQLYRDIFLFVYFD